MDILNYLHDNIWATKALESVIYIIIVLCIRHAANFILDRQEIESRELRLRIRILIRNSLFLVLVIGLFLLWITEIRTIAISLVAVAVALIVATKELILCLTGSLFKVTSASFAIGDRIIAGDFRGEVIDHNLLSTTLLEIGPGKAMHQQTGRAVTLPNSMFLTVPVVNESFTQNYVLHGFSIPIKLSTSWERAEEILLTAADSVIRPYRKEAEGQLLKAARKRGTDVPKTGPRVSFSITDADKLTMICRVPAPIKERGSIEQEIIREFFRQYLSLEDSEIKGPEATEQS